MLRLVIVLIAAVSLAADPLPLGTYIDRGPAAGNCPAGFRCSAFEVA